MLMLLHFSDNIIYICKCIYSQALSVQQTGELRWPHLADAIQLGLAKIKKIFIKRLHKISSLFC